MAKKDVTEIVDRVEKLVRLAQSDNEDEARSAAMQAVRLMSEHELMVLPRVDWDKVKQAVEGAQALAKAAKAKADKNLMMGLALGFFGAKKF